MKKFNSSDLSNNRYEVLKAARKDGALIQFKRSNGKVIEEFELRVKNDAGRTEEF